MLKPGITRFILALLVIFFHLSQSLFFGKFAVGCFFILSGYWIALMYEKKYSKKENHLKAFYISRFWRLLPAFYVFTILGLMVTFFFKPHFLTSFLNLNEFDKIHFIISNLLILGYASTKFNILVPAWSLDIEIQFYLIFPLIAYVIRRKKKLLIYTTALFFLITLFLTFYGKTIFLNTSLPFLYLFFLGGLAYHYNLSPGIKIERWALLAFFLIIAIQYALPSLSKYYRDTNSFYYEALSFALILTAIPSLINSVHQKTNERDKYWGEMSFMVYLCHWVWLEVYNVLIVNSSKMARIPYVSGFLLITFFTSHLIYKFIDRRSEKLRHKWVNSQL